MIVVASIKYPRHRVHVINSLKSLIRLIGMDDIEGDCEITEVRLKDESGQMVLWWDLTLISC